jgi:hypothetical protein
MVQPIAATMATTISGTHFGEVRGPLPEGAGLRRAVDAEDLRPEVLRDGPERDGDAERDVFDDVVRAPPERVPVPEVPRLSPAVAPRCDVDFCAMLS